MARPFALAAQVATALASVVAGQAPSFAGDRTPWTIERILSVPEIKDLALSPDDGSVAYVARRANLALNRPDYELHIVSADGKEDRIVARSPWIDHVRSIPGTRGWSILADFGRGVQLYEIKSDGATHPIVVSDTTAVVGSADGATYGLTDTIPLNFGVFFYDWSPDGKRLFYATLETKSAQGKILRNDDVTAASAQSRWAPEQVMHFFIRDESGKTLRVVTRPPTDKLARYFGAFPTWGDGYMEYGIQADDRNDPAVLRFRWDFRDQRSAPAPIGTSANSRETVVGPHGGILGTVRIGTERRLRERLPQGDNIDYGPTGLTLSDPRSPGNWRSPDGAFTIVAVRLADEARYALLRVNRDRTTKLIQVPESLTHCTFTDAAIDGVCIREGIVTAPQLVRVSSLTGSVSPLRSLSGPFAPAEPLRAEARTWTNSLGFKATGFILYPREYRVGERYPAIVVTHSTDADQRFASADIQWSYPVQAFAEQGYVVVLVNEPYPSQSVALEDANADWNECGGRMPPRELQRRVWLNMVETFKSVVAELTAEGLVDKARIGIAGYSAGSQMTNVAVTQTNLFKAASSGDGGFLEPAPYRYTRCSYQAIYGGPPSDPAAAPNYAALTPSYRAKYASAALLQQVAEPRPTRVDFFQALQAAGVPTEITLYPGETPASDETHMFHIPSNRLAAMQENMEWFDFWLRDISPGTPDDVRRKRWEAMRRNQQSARVSSPSHP